MAGEAGAFSVRIAKAIYYRTLSGGKLRGFPWAQFCQRSSPGSLSFVVIWRTQARQSLKKIDERKENNAMNKLIGFLGVILCLCVLSATQSLPQTKTQGPPQAGPQASPTPATPAPKALPPGPPQARIQNEMVQATVYLPDPLDGFYRGTRFDWSGIVANVGYKGQQWFGQWFVKVDHWVRDSEYDPALRGYVVGTNSAGLGLTEEFSASDDKVPLGYKEAPVGGTFLKIGVGMLRKPSDAKYSKFKTYEIVNGGKWTANKESDRIEIIQELDDPASGYGYVYTKTVSLTKGKPELVLQHSIKNTGKKLIETTVRSHNFVRVNDLPTNAEVKVKFPFAIKTDLSRVGPGLLKLVGEANGKLNEIQFLKEFQVGDGVMLMVEGFSNDPKDFQIDLKQRAGAAVRITSDQPLAMMEVAANRSYVRPAAYVALKAEPGKEFKWSISYQFMGD
jgi:hypothetical protein